MEQGPNKWPRSGPQSAPGAGSIRLTPGPDAGHIVTYADTADIAEAVETVRGLDAGRIVPGETRTDQRSG